MAAVGEGAALLPDHAPDQGRAPALAEVLRDAGRAGTSPRRISSAKTAAADAAERSSRRDPAPPHAIVRAPARPYRT